MDPDALVRRQRRDRLVSRVSVMGQVSALLAMASTGVTAGVLAHDAQVKDLQAAQAKAVAPRPSLAPAVVRLVPRPIRTVLVRVPAPARKALPRKAKAPVVRRTAVQAAPRQVARTVPKAVAPKPAAKPAATTSSGS
jgi:hypothetical protein